MKFYDLIILLIMRKRIGEIVFTIGGDHDYQRLVSGILDIISLHINKPLINQIMSTLLNLNIRTISIEPLAPIHLIIPDLHATADKKRVYFSKEMKVDQHSASIILHELFHIIRINQSTAVNKWNLE